MIEVLSIREMLSLSTHCYKKRGINLQTPCMEEFFLKLSILFNTIVKDDLLTHFFIIVELNTNKKYYI